MVELLNGSRKRGEGDLKIFSILVLRFGRLENLVMAVFC